MRPPNIPDLLKEAVPVNAGETRVFYFFDSREVMLANDATVQKARR